jgi:glutamate racemase
LTVWEALTSHFSHIHTQYLGDNARCPYGNKSPGTILRYSAEAALFLANRGAQILVVACGTASSIAVPALQHTFRMPVLGIVEGLCDQAAITAHNEHTNTSAPIAVLGTQFTIRSGRFKTELHARGFTDVWQRACPLFVPLVEEGLYEGPLIEEVAQIYLKDIPKNVSTVLLACTHYPRLSYAIARVLGQNTGRPVVHRQMSGDVCLSPATNEQRGHNPIVLLDPCLSTIKALEHCLHQPQFQNLWPTTALGQHQILCTDAPEHFASIANLFMASVLPTVEHVNLQESL